MQEEIFGPVVAVMTFETEEDAVSLANDSRFGLSGSIWTRDIGRAIRVSRGIESGNLSGQFAFVGPLLDPFRRVQVVRPRPRAWSGRARLRSPRPRTFSFPPRSEHRCRIAWPARSDVITGAGSGIGLATARRFAADGGQGRLRRPRRRIGVEGRG